LNVITQIGQEFIYLLPTSAHNGYVYCPCLANIVKMIIYVKNHTGHYERLRSSDNMVRLF
jgi:hypothetical protein